MPRRRPGAVRAEQWQLNTPDPIRAIGQGQWLRIESVGPRYWIRGVSGKTNVAIRRLEDTHLRRNAVAEVFDDYRCFIRQPGPLRQAQCPCCPGQDPLSSRQELDEMLRMLPDPARVDFERMMRPLDERLRRNTLLLPGAGRWSGGAWWLERTLER